MSSQQPKVAAEMMPFTKHFIYVEKDKTFLMIYHGDGIATYDVIINAPL
jgi:hypothetical protein